ncbi:MAG TPA: hypothetical protein VLM89_05275 [Phycisphaerae bacterium]|nr:hypothetical protein [Phycisphaerae bacterium]
MASMILACGVGTAAAEQPRLDPLDNLLKSVEKSSAQTPPKPERTPPKPSERSLEAVRSHVSKHWAAPAGPTPPPIEVLVKCDRDGNVIAATVPDASDHADDRLYLAAAGSAVRAVKIASPLPIPLGDDRFREFTMKFNLQPDRR